uniref:F-box domain-containing protein n=2 Tax=Moniliophthora roreri TaxID=221103 RepID=A0A0W0F398_MONRR
MGYQTEINKLKATLASLEQKRDGLKKKIAQYRSLLSPIHRLLPEVLQHILHYAMPKPVNWFEPSSIPSTLSLASAIDFNKWGKQKFHALNHLVRLFFDRTGVSAFTLILDFGNKKLHNGWLPCLETLVRHSNRWRSLELRISRSVLEHSASIPIKGRLPILSHLDISGPLGESDPQFRCDLFTACPVLSSIELCPPSPFTDAACPLPWGQIRNLTLWGCSGIDGLSVLNLLQNVDSLTLQNFGASNEIYGGEHINSDVKRLVIHAECNAEVHCILTNATFPSLSSLDIRGDSRQPNDWTKWEEKPLVDFLIRSPCTITTLSLKYIPISDQQTIWLLQHLPMTLCLEEYFSTDDSSTANHIITHVFLDKLTVDHARASPSFLPKLTRIRLALHYDRLKKLALVKAVASRWITDEVYSLEIGLTSVESIDIVLIDSEDAQVQNLTEELQWMADAGLRVTIAALKLEEDKDE